MSEGNVTREKNQRKKDLVHPGRKKVLFFLPPLRGRKRLPGGEELRLDTGAISTGKKSFFFSGRSRGVL